MNRKVLAICLGVGVLLIAVFLLDDESVTTNDLYAEFSAFHEEPSDSISEMDIYIDASGSMKGYLKGDTDGRFSGAVSKFYACSPNRHLFLLSAVNNIVPYQGMMANLRNRMGAFSGGVTEFDKLLPWLVERSGQGKICLFVTDGILYFNQNTSRGLQEFEQILRSRLNQYQDKGYAIYQYESRFDAPGKGGISYYTMYNTPVPLVEDNRPFYIICVGDKKDIRLLRKNEAGLEAMQAVYMGIHDDEGHRSGRQTKPDAAALIDVNQKLRLYATLPSCLTRFHEQYPTYLQHHLKVLGLRSNGSTAELEPGTYKVSFSKGQNINMNLSIDANTLFGYHDLCVEIENELPDEWTELSVDDDTMIDSCQTKTFGLKYLLEGIRKATETTDAKLVTIRYSVK